MIKDAAAWHAFENQVRKQEITDYARNRRIFTALWQEAVTLGAIPLNDPLSGIDANIRIATTLNGCLKKS